jgi:hypothetical protein
VIISVGLPLCCEKNLHNCTPLFGTICVAWVIHIQMCVYVHVALYHDLLWKVGSCEVMNSRASYLTKLIDCWECENKLEFTIFVVRLRSLNRPSFSWETVLPNEVFVLPLLIIFYILNKLTMYYIYLLY